jgi:DNA repair exonuclease SbcCD ATPase subunit
LSSECPVCQQSIDEEHVAAHLRLVLTGQGSDLASLADAARTSRARLEEANAQLQTAKQRRVELEAQVAAAESIRAARAQWQESLAEIVAETILLNPDQAHRVGDGDRNALIDLRENADQLAGVADELASLLSTSGLGEEVARQRARLNELQFTRNELKTRAAETSQIAEQAKAMASAATSSVAAVTARRFETLQPLVDDIFKRLDPHPAFTTLGFELGVAYRSGFADPFVRDPESDVSGDPLLVLSSSQSNVAALTYFLALSWAAGDAGLPFLLLDDPLQSMDDVNALGFADLCRHLRLRRQLVVSTHDRRLASLLERKLLPREAEEQTRVLRFTGWDRTGPTIESSEVEYEPVGFALRAS